MIEQHELFVEAPASVPADEEAAYRELVFLAERIDRGEKIESWELHDIARRLRRG